MYVSACFAALSNEFSWEASCFKVPQKRALMTMADPIKSETAKAIKVLDNPSPA
eukprot:CAMPEP_0172459516 /NCGR_PEP_ID=MMETSP1065-20121228/32970_1 /TAXON_ID=265537 /ORGANISM="Amphiprora paludosa, Strain CCMP125" /LENGTH=53 /DNA_ID=CAMNT_0013214227 /DNA_START=90 /DNA_END=247 /DNA_ORIENTATION=-